jgi:hypothetical protein
LNRKLIASAVTAGVLSAPVAIAVADPNKTQAAPAPAPVVDVPQVAGDLRVAAQLKLEASHPEAVADRKARAKRRAKALARKRAKKAARRQAAAQTTASPALQAIAACESGGNPAAIGGGGAFRGKYQFDRGTWASVGGSGDPAAAPEAEQDRRAAMLYARAGAAPWPVCGR